MALKKTINSRLPRIGLGIEEARIRNDRQAVFELTRNLVKAQFHDGDQELTQRLWQDIVDRNIDIDRVIKLMYECTFHDDEHEMTKVDEEFQATMMN